jgi:hypothetical protein
LLLRNSDVGAISPSIPLTKSSGKSPASTLSSRLPRRAVGAQPNFLPRCSEIQPRVRFSVGENRRHSINAAKINRKFGKPRDLQSSGPLTPSFTKAVSVIRNEGSLKS